MKQTNTWLPISRQEMDVLGWDEADVILVSGDAYVDHPSFGHAVIGRLLEKQGLRVAILPQPNWRDDLRDFKKLGKPKYFFGVTAGCMDSMVNHYTAARRLRTDDAYTPGGKAGFRPDYAAVVYTKILKQLYPDVPVVLGGIEASLRRFTHYDYWSDTLKSSVLTDSGADLLIYGMGERPLLKLVELLVQGVPFTSIQTIPQTAFASSTVPLSPKSEQWADNYLHSHEACLKSKETYARNFKTLEEESNKWKAARIIQAVNNQYIIANPPYPPANEVETDLPFDLPYTRMPHPRYKNRGEIPAYTMIRHSINTHRGCFGGCSFCTISAHQGKFVQSRSEASILKELEAVSQMSDFSGTITDLGGPSANMYRMKGFDLEKCQKCKRPSCIFPSICPNLNADHKPMTALYKKAMQTEGVKRVFIGSGIRYDLLINQKPEQASKNGTKAYLEQVITNHVSGRLKVAPEHTSANVLKLMRKPGFELFRQFKKEFTRICTLKGLNQQLIPYFISSHPGCTDQDMAELAADTRELGYRLEQIQDFTPTPMTLATEMYYTGLNPYTLQPVYTAKSPREKQGQRSFFFWYIKENQGYIRQKLTQLNRNDLLERIYGRPTAKVKPNANPKARVNRASNKRGKR